MGDIGGVWYTDRRISENERIPRNVRVGMKILGNVALSHLILIGSSDWEDYSLGKEGVQRYRINNLPNSSSCPGLYELGLASDPTNGHKSRKQDSEKIIVVYLGQTSNVRTRLQRYGRVGAHLDYGRLVSSVNENDCPGLFKEIFSIGYSIMFRWAPMIDKKKAEKTEAELLGVFDYAWNKCANGSLRRDEILSKLHSKPASPIKTILKKLQPWKHPSLGRGIGINIDSNVAHNDEKGLYLPQVLKFGKSQLRFIYGSNGLDEDREICGVATGNGSVCKNMHLPGRKRCKEHKGKKIIGTGPVLKNSLLCGVPLEDGSLCAELPAYGRKRCEIHKGQKVTKPGTKIKPHVRLLDQFEDIFWECQSQLEHEEDTSEEDGNICGVVSGGHVCKRKPIFGRKRCNEHKGQRIAVKLSAMSKENSEKKGKSFVCGVGLGDGSVCKRTPVVGRKRCELHKGRRIS